MATEQHEPYFAPEIHSPLIIDEDRTFRLTMSTSNATGKAPTSEAPVSNSNGAARSGGTNIISVEPPKQSDLQVRSLSVNAISIERLMEF